MQVLSKIHKYYLISFQCGRELVWFSFFCDSELSNRRQVSSDWPAFCKLLFLSVDHSSLTSRPFVPHVQQTCKVGSFGKPICWLFGGCRKRCPSCLVLMWEIKLQFAWPDFLSARSSPLPALSASVENPIPYYGKPYEIGKIAARHLPPDLSSFAHPRSSELFQYNLLVTITVSKLV